MTMAGLTAYPELFACGEDEAGPIDLLATAERWAAKGSSNLEYGDLKDRRMLVDISPAYKADRIKVPFMIQQGEKDDSTPDADKVVQKLKQLGAPVEYIVYPDEGHNLYKIENRIKQDVRRVEFFVKHLHPAVPTNLE
jgi:dipeptidyl aminopeptidase/acylaminoacyl peptidase